MALPNFQNVLTRTGSGVLYSTLLLTAGLGLLSNQEFTFFSYGLGGAPTGFAAGVVATICETNLKGNGSQIPGQYAFLAHGMSISYSNFTARAPISTGDMHNLIDNGTVAIWSYQDTDIVISPTAQIPSGTSIIGVAGTAGGVASEIGMGSGILKFPRPVPINPLQAFQVKLKFPASAIAMVVSTAVRCCLYGEYDTAVAAG